MKQNEGYLLKTISGIPYLLPYGQAIADLRRGIRLNETGVFIWQQLKTVHDPRTLLDILASHYKTAPQERPMLEKDMTQFLNILRSYGMITDDQIPGPVPEALCHRLMIGGILLDLCGPKDAFSKEFVPFVSSSRRPADLKIHVHINPPHHTKNGPILLRNRELLICDLDTFYLVLFPQATQIAEAHLSKDGSCMHFYCRPPFEESLATDLFHAIRLGFLYLAQKRGMFALHSASILYKEKAWLFSGHSGMGKSTHVRLWKEQYQTPIINGDLNLLAIENGRPLIHGTPWCGTSGISDPKAYPLGGIILLGRSVDNLCEELTADEKTLLVMQRLISPSWTAELFDRNFHFSEALTSQLPICRLRCNRDPSAARAAKSWIDRQL